MITFPLDSIPLDDLDAAQLALLVEGRKHTDPIFASSEDFEPVNGLSVGTLKRAVEIALRHAALRYDGTRNGSFVFFSGFFVRENVLAVVAAAGPWTPPEDEKEPWQA
jgi:hypothetical protein